MKELEEQKRKFEDTIIGIQRCYKEGRWIELRELTKELDRIAFRIYMMTDTGEGE